MRSLFPAFLLFISCLNFLAAQEKVDKEFSGDPLYREDQFYIGITYNFLANKPEMPKNQGLSGGIHGGYLRDIPLNKRRNVAVAVGLGFVYDQFGHNFFIGRNQEEQTIFRILDEHVHYDRNRFNMAGIEIPIEFRWRTSTATEYRFWRIYAGARIGYSYWYKSSFTQENNRVVLTKIPEFQPFRISGTLAFGYSTFNFFVSYTFNPLFKEESIIDNIDIDFNAVKIGLLFYIL